MPHHGFHQLEHGQHGLLLVLPLGTQRAPVLVGLLQTLGLGVHAVEPIVDGEDDVSPLQLSRQSEGRRVGRREELDGC